MKQYFVHIVSDVTRQCTNKQLIPSLLFRDCRFDKNEGIYNLMRNIEQVEPESGSIKGNDTITNGILGQPLEKLENIPPVNGNTAESKENALKLLIESVNEEQITLKELHESKKRLEQELIEAKERKTDGESALKNTKNTIKLKKQTIAVISKEDNLIKLRKKVEEANENLIELANKWNEIQAPLLEEYWSLQNTLSKEQLSIQKEEQKLENMKAMHKSLEGDLKEKEILEENLIKKCQQMNNSNNRYSFTLKMFNYKLFNFISDLIILEGYWK